MSFRLLVTAICLVIAAGCKTVADEYDQPARITNVDEASRAALQAAVNEVIGTEVLLSDAAFTERSVLVIENWPRPTLQNPQPQGRIMQEPIRLVLVINDGNCLLVDTRDGSRHPLENVNCVAE